MKTSFTIIATLFAMVIHMAANAQNNNPRQQDTHGNSQSERRYYSGNGNNSVNGYYGGGYYFNYGDGSNYYNNSYNLKKAARMNIRRSAQIIGDAVYSSEWNDSYSPWLAKAIRHQQYARQLYFYGDYAGALNHAERAAFLAISTLNYYNNGGGYNNGDYGYNNGGGNYPNPYGDPNNPYYRQQNTNNQPNTNEDNEPYDQGNINRKTTQNNAQKPVELSNDIDSKLPQDNISDKELLKTNAKDLSVD